MASQQPLPGSRPPVSAVPVGRAAPVRPHTAPPEKPLLLGDVSFVLIGLTGVLVIALAMACAVLLGALQGVDINLVWFATRGTGIAAYLLMVGVMIYGILLSARASNGELPAPVSYAMHDYLTWLSLIFTAVHVFVLLLDQHVGYSLAQLLIPGTSAYQPLWIGVGQVGTYVFLAVTLSLYVKKLIGQRTWRIIHYLSYLSFLMVLAHSLFAGSDTTSLVMQIVYAVSAIAVAGLTVYRVLYAIVTRGRRRVA